MDYHDSQWKTLIWSKQTSRDQYLEIQGIAVRSGDVDLELYNVYIPPVASCPTGYRPDIRSILDGNIRLVFGDFNAHHQLWHSRLGDDQRGTLLAEQIDESTLCTLNDDAPTRIMGTCASSPDITLASAGLINCTTLQTVVSLGSDHLPIIVSLERPNDFIVSERRTYMNQKKADWRGFREFIDRRFGELPVPSNVRIAERKFREIINAAVARFVPSGRISVVRPHFPAEAARLADKRNDIHYFKKEAKRLEELGIWKALGLFQYQKLICCEGSIFILGKCKKEAFQNLKQQLISDTKISHFDDNLPILLSTDT
ncbi:uncharacterized protein ACRADG_012216 [Cochliomyia hominivorax]